MSDELNANRDPLTNEAGAHPVGTGVGAVLGGGAAGAAAGALGGPVGAVVGGVAGAVAGGLAGKATAEMVNPTAEDAYWRNAYSDQPYYETGRTYDEYRPAYALGWSAVDTYTGPFEEFEPQLQDRWNTEHGASRLDWNTARTPVYAAWERAQAHRGGVGGSGPASVQDDGQPMIYNDNVVDVLNDLLESCLDGEQGYRASAEHARTGELQSLFTRRSNECLLAAGELAQAVLAHGGTPADGGTLSGALHRSWMSIKTALSSNDDKIVLEECERGEDAAVARYQKALEHALPPDVQALVQRQAEGARRNHNEVKALRDRYTASS